MVPQTMYLHLHGWKAISEGNLVLLDDTTNKNDESVNKLSLPVMWVFVNLQ
jgi:hypothetical protein